MAVARKFFDVIGFATSEKLRPGVTQEVITERKFYGDVVYNGTKFQEAETVNPGLRLQNSISILADAYLNEHFYAIRYVKWNGVRWTVEKVELAPPRLILRLGVMYNGKTPQASGTP